MAYDTEICKLRVQDQKAVVRDTIDILVEE